MNDAQPHCAPGDRVRVTQQIARTNGVWTNTVEGVVVSCGQSKTGSWFAHTKDNRVWLDRLALLCDDGEQVVCNLDRCSRVEVLTPNA